jgi:hypothetical protein
MTCRQAVFGTLFAIAIWPLSPAFAQQGNTPEWGSDLSRALQEAKKNERPLLVYVFDDD